MIKALFFDVDGTLVSFKTHKIPERTIQALQMAHDQGVKIFTATGRPRQLLNNIPEVEHLMDGYILATGALCIYGETVVREDLISHEEVLALVDHCRRHNISSVVVGAMADYLGFDISETMAFGDGGNDRPMLCAAGIGVAMGNAVDEVKAHADYVTSTVDEDGVWNALRHFDII